MELLGIINGNGTTTSSSGGNQTKHLLLSPNPLPSLSSRSSPGSNPAGAGSTSPTGPQTENEKVYWLIVDLMNTQTREAALLELSKKREQWDDLALVLWHSFGERTSGLDGTSS